MDTRVLNKFSNKSAIIKVINGARGLYYVLNIRRLSLSLQCILWILLGVRFIS